MFPRPAKSHNAIQFVTHRIPVAFLEVVTPTVTGFYKHWRRVTGKGDPNLSVCRQA